MSEPVEDRESSAPVRFIKDTPASDDFFETHTRLASAMAAAIRTNPNLRVVGLLGRWGSGKSTVVEHLKTILESASAPRMSAQGAEQATAAAKKRLSEALSKFERGTNPERRYWAEVTRNGWRLKR